MAYTVLTQQAEPRGGDGRAKPRMPGLLASLCRAWVHLLGGTVPCKADVAVTCTWVRMDLAGAIGPGGLCPMAHARFLGKGTDLVCIFLYLPAHHIGHLGGMARDTNCALPTEWVVAGQRFPYHRDGKMCGARSEAVCQAICRCVPREACVPHEGHVHHVDSVPCMTCVTLMVCVLHMASVPPCGMYSYVEHVLHVQYAPHAACVPHEVGPARCVCALCGVARVPASLVHPLPFTSSILSVPILALSCSVRCRPRVPWEGSVLSGSPPGPSACGGLAGLGRDGHLLIHTLCESFLMPGAVGDACLWPSCAACLAHG